MELVQRGDTPTLEQVTDALKQWQLSEAADVSERLWSRLWIFIVLAVSATGFGFLAAFNLRRTNESLSYTWRQAYFASVLKLDMGWFDVKNPLLIPTRLNQDIGALTEVLGMKFQMAVSSCFMLLGGLAYAVYACWPMLFVALPMFLFVGGGMYLSTEEDDVEERTHK